MKASLPWLFQPESKGPGTPSGRIRGGGGGEGGREARPRRDAHAPESTDALLQSVRGGFVSQSDGCFSEGCFFSPLHHFQGQTFECVASFD